jgi:hypothetical protein
MFIKIRYHNFQMDRKDLRALSRVRLSEARALLQAGLPDGAYHLGGYAVECALEASPRRRAGTSFGKRKGPTPATRTTCRGRLRLPYLVIMN